MGGAYLVSIGILLYYFCMVQSAPAQPDEALAVADTGIGNLYSRSLPKPLRDKFAAALNDEDLATTRHGIALMEVRIVELLQTLNEGGAGLEAWRSAKSGVEMMRDAVDSGDADRQVAGLLHLEQIVETGLNAASTWEDIGRWLEAARRLRETEQRRLIALQSFITAEQALALISALTFSIRVHVQDESALASIDRDFARLIGAANTLVAP